MKEVEIVIPSSPADRKALADGIKEMSNAMFRMEGEKAYIDESIKALKDKFSIDAKYLRKLLTDFHKDQFDKVVDEAEQYGDLYDAVFNSKAPSPDDDDEGLDNDDDSLNKDGELTHVPADYNDEAA